MPFTYPANGVIALIAFIDLPLFPSQASAQAERVDRLFFFILAITGTVGLLVTILLVVFSVRYRRGRSGLHTPRITGSTPLELFWTIAPVFVFLVMAIWGMSVYSTMLYPPADAEEVYVVGKQWMWKIQHPGGQREINTLRLPVDRPVRVTLISEDVIHDFGTPEFRTKVDVLPGRYVTTWYKPTQIGSFHLFCDQYCGTGHSSMVGRIIVMDRADYDAWLNSHAEGSLALEGRKLFLKLQCITCHSADSKALAPVLEDLYGRRVFLEGGGDVLADENYIRESIVNPRAKIVRGWQPIMPTFQGQVSEEDLLKLVAFIKALRPGGTPDRNETFPAPAGAPTTPEERKRP